MIIIRESSTQRVSKVVIHNDVVYLSGQVAKDVSEDVVGQSKSVLANVDHYLAEAGTGISKILHALIHLKDHKDAGTFNEIWNAWLPVDCAPAVMLRDVVLIEVTVVAAL